MSFRENENKKITQSFEMFSENDCLRAVAQTILKNTCSNKKKSKIPTSSCMAKPFLVNCSLNACDFTNKSFCQGYNHKCFQKSFVAEHL